ncbi:MAG: GtrA family protein [Clostridia bacterium]|nr:GtrA family protein [Clostridia bacterium]
MSQENEQSKEEIMAVETAVPAPAQPEASGAAKPKESFSKKLMRYSLPRYMVVGMTGALVDFLVFKLASRSLPETVPIFGTGLANAAGMVVGAAWCFLLNRFWSFRAKGHFWRQAASYAGLMVVNIFLSSGILLALQKQLSLPLDLCKLAAMAIIFVWNYLINRFWIFRKDKE